MNSNRKKPAKSPINDKTVRSLLELESGSDSSTVADNTDSDPTYEPEDSDQRSSSVMRICKKRLFSGDSNSTPKKIKTNVSTDTTRNITPVLQFLIRRLQEFEKQLNYAKRNGNKSTVKRKAKRIAQFKSLISDVKSGKDIELSNLPDPFCSPVSKKQRLTDSELKSFKSAPTLDQVHTLHHEKNKCNDELLSQESSPTNVKSCIYYEDEMSGVKYDRPSVQNKEMDVNQPPTLQSNEKSNKYNSINTAAGKLKRKENYCIECKKMVKEFCKHYENVHRDTHEGKQLNSLNKVTDKALKKKLKMQITEILRKRGNAEFSKANASNSFFMGQDCSVITVKRFSKSCANQGNCVQCAHCQGFYNRRKFSRHLRNCTVFNTKINTPNNLEGTVNALSEHSLPVLQSINGASEELIKEVLAAMKPRKVKDVALRDPLIMKYASEFYKTRRVSFQRMYVSRVIIDLAKVLMRMQEVEENITCLEDCLTPEHFSNLVSCILQEAGYDEESGTVQTCGLGNRLRSHIKAAAETAKTDATAIEYKEKSPAHGQRRKKLKHFLKIMEEKWANEVGRIFDVAVKKSRSEKEPKLAVEEDIVKTCNYIKINYRKVIEQLEGEVPGSVEKQKSYNLLMDLLVAHIMCLIRRRPVDFKRAKNLHYEKMDCQEDLISEIKNSRSMNLSDEDLELCKKFQIFYVPGKGWKEMVPIALTNVMREALDSVQRNKSHVGITTDTLFIRAGGKPIDPRESLRKVTANLILKKPLHMSGNGLRHHAGTFSKLHSSHPQYQDYLASALGHTLHIHRLHYEMPTSITQKLIVCPVLHKMTVSNAEDSESQVAGDAEKDQMNPGSPDVIHNDSMKPVEIHTPEKDFEDYTTGEENNELESDSVGEITAKTITRQRWTNEEKKCIYNTFGQNILEREFPLRSSIVNFYQANATLFQRRTVDSLVTFIHNNCSRKQKNVTPEVKKHMSTHRRITNVPL